MDSEYFEKSWKVSCFGGFLFGREALKRMVLIGGGTIIYTGATVPYEDGRISQPLILQNPDCGLLRKQWQRNMDHKEFMWDM